MTFEAYKIGIKISLINHVSTGLGIMAGDFTKAERKALLLENRLKLIQLEGIKLKGVMGGMMFGAGAAGMMLLKGSYEEAKKLAQAQADFQNLNLSALDNSRVFGVATNLSHKTLGTTITNNIKLIQDLHTATGDLNKSLRLSGAYSQFSVAARVQNGGQDVDNLVLTSIKALEHRGDKVVQSPVALQQELHRQSQVFFATKGRVSPSDYFHLSQTGKMAYTLADSDFLYGPMAAMMQAKTGQTTGTAQMTTLSSLIGGHMTNKAKGFLRGMGLWDDQTSPLAKGLKDLINNDPLVKKLIAAQGDVSIQSGGLPAYAAAMAAGNTDKFTREILVPAIRKKYGNLSDEQIGLMLTKQFNRNTADDLSFWVLNAQKVKKDTGIINKSNGFGGAYRNYLKTPEGAEEAAGAAWKNFLAMFGSVYLPVITKGLLKLAGVLNSLSIAVKQHPGLFKGIVIGLAGLAGALMFGGMVLLISAAFRGLAMALAFTGIGGLPGIAGLAARFVVLGAAMKMAFGWVNALALAGAAGYAVGGVINKHLPDGAGNAIGSFLVHGAALLGNQDARDAVATQDKYTRSHAQVSGKIRHGDVYIDGKKAGVVLTPHVTAQQSKAANRPQSGASFHDGSMSLPAVAGGR
jgi:hypothetical protein